MKRLFLLFLSVAAGLSVADVCVRDGDSVAFLGDSITQYGARNPVGYVNLVMDGLARVGVEATAIHAGNSGDKVAKMRSRLNRDALSKGPRWVTVCGGVNDLWRPFRHGATFEEIFEHYRRAMTAILDTCAASNATAIVLTSPMTEAKQTRFNEGLDRFNDWLKGEAERRGLRVADVNAAAHAEIAGRGVDATKVRCLTKDGVHMAFDGDCLMAWTVLRAMGVPESERDGLFAAWCARKEELDAAHRAETAAKRAAVAAKKESAETSGVQ